MASSGNKDRLPRIVELGRYCVFPSDGEFGFEELDSPTRKQLFEFLQSLDGRTVDQVVAEVELPSGEIATMYAEGGRDGSIAFIIGTPEAFFYLTSGQKRSDECEIQSGGIMREIPVNQLVPVSLVLDVASDFLSNGEPPASQSWDVSPRHPRKL